MKVRLAFACAAPLLAAPAVARPAWAAERGDGSRTMAFEYTAPTDCPGASDFSALVVERAGAAWRLREISRQGPDQPRFVVEIVEAASGAPGSEKPAGNPAGKTAGKMAGKTGRLRLVGSAATTAPREISAPACVDVVRALAFTAALSLGDESASITTAVATSAVPAPPAPTLRREASRAPAGRLFSFGLTVPATVILRPYPMLGVGLFLERGDADWTGRFFHRPDLRLTVAHVRNDLLGQLGQDGRAGFALTTGTLAACPLGISALRGCAAVEAGALEGWGRQIDTPDSDRSFWLALGGLVRTRTTVGTWGFVEASLGAWAPLRRAGFVFTEPMIPVGRVPVVVASGTVAFGLSIP